MKNDNIEMYSGRIYCPSTDEEIFNLDWEPINETATALIAAWFSCVIEDPVFNNESIKNDWESFFENCSQEEKQSNFYDFLSAFLENYDAPQWRVYQVETSGISCGPSSNTDWYVVLADTVIEGNEYDH